MNGLKRMIAMLLAMFLLFSVTACGSDGGANRGKADPTQSGTAAGTEEKDYIAEYNRLRENYTKEVAGLAPDDVLCTVNGEGVTVEEVLYQFTNLCLYLNSQSMTTGMMLDLSMDIGDGTTLGQYVFNQAVDTAIQQVLLMQKAEELKLCK